MIISDLNHLENAAEQPNVVGASGSKFFGVNGFVNVGANVFGNTARVDGLAEAFGPGTFTNVQGATRTAPGASQSTLHAVSATSSPFFFFH
ncbi:MAG: hypothetical protein F6K50_18420 [Moorea sp. SIO3I7]|uniref:Uncharacterized protein n=1 Tax=Moorena bouillonii PNG TaxID=568701 RepID=A0A1U7MVM4_9CYAN|nr:MULTISPECIES: hypothetical protein [Moorena]NEN97424.1 hypothetical protein [Moorena sp. SIO3I7]NEO50055.1 hypothetical protein [Moorena sp. SIO4A3]NEO59740.1 hypothetical protein [Moorena sp. SIO4G2]NEQ80529.1 hypothetical protein [Moorena sp. SIO2I5]NEO08220.1 hypothetical protein [Moorena sp. SIO3I8]